MSKKQTNSIQWQFQNPKTIIKLLQREKMHLKTKESQCKFILKKLNCCFIYYLLKECDDYFFDLEEGNYTEQKFIYIEKIEKGNEIIFDIENFKNEWKDFGEIQIERIKRKIQMEKLAEIVEKESGMKIEFNEVISCLELVNFVDENGNEIDLMKFMKKYEKYEKLFEIVLKQIEERNVNGNKSKSKNDISNEEENENEMSDNDDNNNNEKEKENEFYDKMNEEQSETEINHNEIDEINKENDIQSMETEIDMRMNDDNLLFNDYESKTEVNHILPENNNNDNNNDDSNEN